MRYRLQRHDGTDCSATMVPITVLRMVPIQRYRQLSFLLSVVCLACVGETRRRGGCGFGKHNVIFYLMWRFSQRGLAGQL